MDFEQYLLGAAATALSAVTIFLGMHYRSLAHGRLRFSMNLGAGVNPGGIGTHLAALVTISNPGQQSLYFGGFYAIDSHGDRYYPSSTFAGGTRLEPGQYIQGTIPVGHLLSPGVRRLAAVDGLGNSYRVGSFVLRQVLRELRKESRRLKALGLE